MSRVFKVGFLGVAHFHAESYAQSLRRLPNVEIAGVFDDDASLGKKFADDFGTQYYRDISSLLDRGLDAVVVTSENSKHYEHIIQALDRGLHILCEKPMTIRVEEAEDVVRRVEKKRVKFQMCYVMRYHTTSLLVKELVERKEIGKLVAMVGTNKLNRSLPLRRGWFTDPALSGGGAVMDHTVHLADLMRWYASDEVEEVYTEVGRNVNGALRVEDNFFTTVQFRSGVVGHIDGSWTYASGIYTWGDVTMELIGTEGVAFLDAFRQNVYFIGDREPQAKLSYVYYGCDADFAMVEDFKRCVEMDLEPRAGVRDGLEGVKITLASYESVQKGAPVKIPRAR